VKNSFPSKVVLASLFALSVLPLLADPTATPAATPTTEPPVAPATASTPAPAAPVNDAFFAISHPPAGAPDPSWAGLAGVSTGAPWEKTASWTQYSDFLTKRWAAVGRARMIPMRTWASAELGDITSKSRTVFYPFSGPDFLYEDTLFPDAQNVLMAGLEPVGAIPDLKALQASGQLDSFLNSITNSLKTIINASFFRTLDMKNDYHNGLSPVLFVFIGKQGYTVDDYEYVSVDNDGNLSSLKGPDDAKGIRISYHRPGSDTHRTLVYFSVNLADDGLKEHPGFVNLMKKLAPGITYLKAASYLLHDSYFSIIRDAILDDSIGVVEDDSGIPYQYFKPAIWTVKPYGNYTGPIGLFSTHDQADLHAYFKAQKPAELPFGSGYKYVRGDSSLIVAIKK
jgi:hypothetical protein